MAVIDFLDYCTDAGMLNVELYDVANGEVVWSGFGDEIPDEYLYAEVDSFDIPVKRYWMTFNISL